MRPTLSLIVVLALGVVAMFILVGVARRPPSEPDPAPARASTAPAPAPQVGRQQDAEEPEQLCYEDCGQRPSRGWLEWPKYEEPSDLVYSEHVTEYDSLVLKASIAKGYTDFLFYNLLWDDSVIYDVSVTPAAGVVLTSVSTAGAGHQYVSFELTHSGETVDLAHFSFRLRSPLDVSVRSVVVGGSPVAEVAGISGWTIEQEICIEPLTLRVVHAK